MCLDYYYYYLRNLQNRLSAIITRGVIRVFIFRTLTQNLYLSGKERPCLHPLTYTCDPVPSFKYTGRELYQDLDSALRAEGLMGDIKSSCHIVNNKAYYSKCGRLPKVCQITH